MIPAHFAYCGHCQAERNQLLGLFDYEQHIEPELSPPVLADNPYIARLDDQS